MTSVLVTGCAGFIGSNLTARLIRDGYDVRGIDDLSSGKAANIKGLDFEFVRGSICDEKLLKKQLKSVDFVFHQAAIPSVVKSLEDPVASNNANVVGTLNLLVCAREAAVKKIVYASSSSVYGNSPTLPKKESMPLDPISPYALTKYAGEMYAKQFTKFYGLETVGLRYFNVFGPRQDPSSQYSAVIPKFITAVINGKTPVIYGDGKTTRDFTYIDDVVHANIQSMKAGPDASGKAFNIACGSRISLNGLLDEINDISGAKAMPRYEDERPGDVKHSIADISLARKFLKYDPKNSLREGLEKTVRWYREA